MTRRANVDSGAKIGVVVLVFGFLFAFGLLAWDEVMLGEFWAGAIA